MGNKLYAGYEKKIVSKLIKVKHIIRPRLNSTARDFRQLLKNVPDDAIIEMIDGDDGYDGYGEIIFVEEKPTDF